MSSSDVEIWQERAVCRRETPSVPVWTADREPTKLVLVHLEQMCDRCPVKAQCAVQALEDEAEAGIYAGVHVPEKHRRQRWLAARAKLQRLCGAEAGVVAEEVCGVSA